MFKLNTYKVLILPSLMVFFVLLLFKKTEFEAETKFKRYLAVRINNFLKVNDTTLLPYRDKKQNTSSVMKNQSIVVNRHLVAMTDKLTYFAGDEVNILVNSLYSGDIIISTVTSLKRTKISQFEFQANKRFGAMIFNSMTGFDDKNFVSYKYKLKPQDVGWIQITVKTKAETQNIPIFVDNTMGNQALFVESTDTMKAYVSAYGMKTHYGPKIPVIKGAFTRPHKYPVDYELKTINDNSNINCHEHLANTDFILKSALSAKNIKFDNVADDFVKEYENIKNYKLIIFGAHNEYWSVRKIFNIQKFIDNGGSVLILGGNTCWRFIESTEKYDVTFGSDLYGTYYESFIHNYLGSHYDARGYATSAPFQINKNMYKLLSSEKIADGGFFGVGSDIKHCKDKILGASGHETDKLSPKANGFSILATGNNDNKGGADIVYKSFDSGGKVLNFGSIGLWHKINDPVILELITNFIDSTEATTRGAGVPSI